jgi:hypothetical protein
MAPGAILPEKGVIRISSGVILKESDKCRIGSGGVLKPPYKCRIARGVVLKTSGVILIVSGVVLMEWMERIFLPGSREEKKVEDKTVDHGLLTMDCRP